MTSDRSVLERQIDRVELRPFTLERFHRRRQRKDRNRRIGSAVVALAVAAAGIGGLVRAFSSRTIPASDPFLGVFEPVAGRIVYVNEGIDRGYDPGLWAVDPNGPSDTTEGPSVADDVASTLVRLDLEEAPRGWSNDGTELQLLGWSSDGTELLFTRWNEGFEQYLYVLHADGSETRLNEDPMFNARAAISPDGSRVAFTTDGLYVVDADGGRPVRLPVPVYPADGDPVGGSTFSPDGTQIAYLANDGVWVVNADGSDAHEILANEATRNAGAWFSGMQWSPAGDRIAIGLGGDPAIYTFAPDGSDFTRVITGGVSPYWSPDGSQIAYTIPCDEHPNASCPEGSPRRSLFDPQPGDSPAGLAIADTDGSNVRAFGFAASGPWHPVPADQPTTPPPAPSGAPPAFMGEQLAGVWLQTGAADLHKVLTFATDGTFVMEAADRDAYGAVDGTYQVQGDTITFTDPERGCPLMKWTGGHPGGDEPVPHGVDFEFTITDTGAGDCTAPSGFHVEGMRLHFVRISPRSPETDSWEMESEFDASRHPQETPPSLRRLAGIWFQDDGEHVLRISPGGEYTIGVGEDLVTDPANTGTISFGDDGTIEFTSGPESRTCVEGTVMTWRDVRVARYDMQADVEGDPCGSLPVGPTSWHNLIRY